MHGVVSGVRIHTLPGLAPSPGNGQNFLTIVASNGESIVSTTIDAPGGFHDLRQPRISGAEAVTSPVPEPATITMMGLGAVGMALLRKFRKV